MFIVSIYQGILVHQERPPQKGDHPEFGENTKTAVIYFPFGGREIPNKIKLNTHQEHKCLRPAARSSVPRLPDKNNINGPPKMGKKKPKIPPSFCHRRTGVWTKIGGKYRMKRRVPMTHNSPIDIHGRFSTRYTLYYPFPYPFPHPYPFPYPISFAGQKTERKTKRCTHK